MSSITERRREEVAMSVWSNRFLKSAIVQGSIVTGLANNIRVGSDAIFLFSTKYYSIPIAIV